MKISFEWLKEFVDLRESPEEIAERLTMAGLEVEAVTHQAAPFSGVVAAEVRTVERHPSADKLSVCRVWDGRDELEVVCGAPNVRAGAKVAFVRVGGAVSGRAIARAKLRGVESNGMICSERELGLPDEHAGIWLIDDPVGVGDDIAQFLGFGDTILDVNLTPNRPDALSHMGIARELGAILDRDTHFPTPTVPVSPQASALPSVEILDQIRCPRYAARMLTGVKVGPAPRAMRLRLLRLGVRTISNIVDITNYVLRERGHPLHAFDHARLAGGRIVVRTARPGELLTTLDGAERVLAPTDLVIADAERAQALAGVMGGATSEVTAATSTVLVESAYFDPIAIRKTARRLGIHTEASHRFERGTNPDGLLAALDRVAELAVQCASATVASGPIDVYPRPITRAPIRLRSTRPAFVLGAAPAPEFIATRFERLGLSRYSDDAWTPPPWRPDLTREIDLIEEIARLWGYENIPPTLPRSLPFPGVAADERPVDALRASLVGLGFLEATNLSFTSSHALDPFDGARPRVRLQNPLSKDYADMRTTLFPSLLANVAFNQAIGESDLRLFEIGRVFTPAAATSDAPSPPPRERLRAALVLVGRRAPDAWESNSAEADFADLKGVAEIVVAALCAVPGTWHPTDLATFHPGASFEYRLPSTSSSRWLLRGGELHPELAPRLGLRGRLLLMEIDLTVVAERVRPRFADLPRTPATLRDVAIVVPDATDAGGLADAIREQGGGIVEEVRLFDLYRGSPVPAGKKSLAFSIRYRARERTLTDDEVNAIHERIVKKLQILAGADIRS